jgi:hypothetical protein
VRRRRPVRAGPTRARSPCACCDVPERKRSHAHRPEPDPEQRRRAPRARLRRLSDAPGRDPLRRPGGPVGRLRHIDTAAAYGNEREVGEAIAKSGVNRAEVFVETKIWISDYGYDQTLHGFEKSAKKLGLDRIDLLILHQALPSQFDQTLEAYRALETLLEVMLRWHVQQGRSAIPKSTKPARIAENIDVFDFELTTGQLAAIDGLDTGKRGGPEPADITLETFGRSIPDA